MSHLHSNSTITPINIEVNGPKRTTIFPSEGGQNVQCDSSTPRPSFLPTGAVAGCRGPRRTYSANVVQEAVRRGRWIRMGGWRVPGTILEHQVVKQEKKHTFVWKVSGRQTCFVRQLSCSPANLR